MDEKGSTTTTPCLPALVDRIIHAMDFSRTSTPINKTDYTPRVPSSIRPTIEPKVSALYTPTQAKILDLCRSCKSRPSLSSSSRLCKSCRLRCGVSLENSAARFSVMRRSTPAKLPTSSSRRFLSDTNTTHSSPSSRSSAIQLPSLSDDRCCVMSKRERVSHIVNKEQLQRVNNLIAKQKSSTVTVVQKPSILLSKSKKRRLSESSVNSSQSGSDRVAEKLKNKHDRITSGNSTSSNSTVSLSEKPHSDVNALLREPKTVLKSYGLINPQLSKKTPHAKMSCGMREGKAVTHSCKSLSMNCHNNEVKVSEVQFDRVADLSVTDSGKSSVSFVDALLSADKICLEKRRARHSQDKADRVKDNSQPSHNVIRCQSDCEIGLLSTKSSDGERLKKTSSSSQRKDPKKQQWHYKNKINRIRDKDYHFDDKFTKVSPRNITKKFHHPKALKLPNEKLQKGIVSSKNKNQRLVSKNSCKLSEIFVGIQDFQESDTHKSALPLSLLNDTRTSASETMNTNALADSEMVELNHNELFRADDLLEKSEIDLCLSAPEPEFNLFENVDISDTIVDMTNCAESYNDDNVPPVNETCSDDDSILTPDSSDTEDECADAAADDSDQVFSVQLETGNLTSRNVFGMEGVLNSELTESYLKSFIKSLTVLQHCSSSIWKSTNNINLNLACTTFDISSDDFICEKTMESGVVDLSAVVTVEDTVEDRLALQEHSNNNDEFSLSDSAKGDSTGRLPVEAITVVEELADNAMVETTQLADSEQCPEKVPLHDKDDSLDGTKTNIDNEKSVETATGTSTSSEIRTVAISSLVDDQSMIEPTVRMQETQSHQENKVSLDSTKMELPVSEIRADDCTSENTTATAEAREICEPDRIVWSTESETCAPVLEDETPIKDMTLTASLTYLSGVETEMKSMLDACNRFVVTDCTTTALRHELSAQPDVYAERLTECVDEFYYELAHCTLDKQRKLLTRDVLSKLDKLLKELGRFSEKVAPQLTTHVRKLMEDIHKIFRPLNSQPKRKTRFSTALQEHSRSPYLDVE